LKKEFETENGIIGFAIHQEKLLNSEQRNEMKKYWTEIIEKLMKVINEQHTNNRKKF